MNLARWSLLPLALLAACGSADADGDGLSNAEEAELGSDPKQADGDGDGLDDLAEQDAGTDPTLADTDGDGLSDSQELDAGLDPKNADVDGDGMSDGDELKYGFDPNDPKSDGYKHGWPMQEVAVKDGLVEQGGPTGDRIEIGKRFKRLRLVDQYRDEVDLYDFAGHGKKVVIDTSAQWCPPCQFVSEAIAGKYTREDLIASGVSAAEADKVVGLAEGLANGDLYWVTVMAENNAGGAPDRDTVVKWDEDYGNGDVPILIDTEKSMVPYMINVGGGWPTIAMVNESMTITWISGDVPFQDLIDIYDRTIGKQD